MFSNRQRAERPFGKALGLGAEGVIEPGPVVLPGDGRGQLDHLPRVKVLLLAEVADALRDRNAPRLRQAAHKFCPMLFAFSTVAGNVASDLEDYAAQGQLEEAQPLVERLETMTQELTQLVGGLKIQTLRKVAEPADDPTRTASS